MLRRDRVQSVLRLPGVSRPEDVIAAIVARYRVLFLEDILVRRRMANQGTGFPEAVLAGRLLEDLCFQLGGGRWADPLARAQVRNQLADSLDARGQHARQAAQLREAARALQGNAIPGSSTESGMIRSFAHIPRWKLPRSGAAADGRVGRPAEGQVCGGDPCACAPACGVRGVAQKKHKKKGKG